MNNEETSPSHNKGRDNMTSNEDIVTNLIQGEDMPPVPSTSVDAAGGVVRPMPSNTVTTWMISALTGEIFSTALSTSARDTPASMYGPRINSTRMVPNRVVNWNDKGSNNMTSNEVIVTTLNQGEDMPPSRIRVTIQLVRL